MLPPRHPKWCCYSRIIFLSLPSLLYGQTYIEFYGFYNALTLLNYVKHFNTKKTMLWTIWLSRLLSFQNINSFKICENEFQSWVIFAIHCIISCCRFMFFFNLFSIYISLFWCCSLSSSFINLLVSSAFSESPT